MAADHALKPPLLLIRGPDDPSAPEVHSRRFTRPCLAHSTSATPGRALPHGRTTGSRQSGHPGLPDTPATPPHTRRYTRRLRPARPCRHASFGVCSQVTEYTGQVFDRLERTTGKTATACCPVSERASASDSMCILLRITHMARRYRTRLILAYVSFFAAIGFALLVPRLFGQSIDRLVKFDPADGRLILSVVDTGTLALMALAPWGQASCGASPTWHGRIRLIRCRRRWHTICAISCMTSCGIELCLPRWRTYRQPHVQGHGRCGAIRRFVNLGLVRPGCGAPPHRHHQHFSVFELETGATQPRLCAVFSPAVDPGAAEIRPMWLRVQEITGESVTVLQENLVGDPCREGICR